MTNASATVTAVAPVASAFLASMGRPKGGGGGVCIQVQGAQQKEGSVITTNKSPTGDHKAEEQLRELRFNVRLVSSGIWLISGCNQTLHITSTVIGTTQTICVTLPERERAAPIQQK
ncbi:hypothetical protein WMY93_011061 [Mugilogobius chulae]|uniref:Uncharacterized protein n=1 Tax=Mugilogobius chulae TaxID=88201 RepID=A0AAW0P945_9GOBI